MFGFGEPGDLKHVPALLWPGEDMQMYARAISGNVIGILVLTNRRVLFVGKGFSGNRTEDFTFEQIVSLDCNTPPLLGYSTITIQAKGGFSKFENVTKDKAQEFAQRTREAIHASKTAAASSTSPMDKYAVLEKLAELKSKGILSEDEFQTEKAKALNS